MTNIPESLQGANFGTVYGPSEAREAIANAEALALVSVGSPQVIAGIDENGDAVAIAVELDGSVKTVGGSGGGGSVYGDWQTLATYTNASPSSFNSEPASFAALTSPPSKITKIQVLPQISVSASSGGAIYPWVSVNSKKYSLSAIAFYPGQNGLSVLDSNGSLDGVDPYEYIVDLPDTAQFGVRVVASSPITTFSPNGVAGNCFAANPGYTGGELVNLATTGTLPRGLAGTIDSFDASADVPTISGVSFASGELCRINTTNLIAQAIPPLGISARSSAALVDLSTNEIVLDGTITGTTFSAGDTVRFRVAPGSTFPSINGGLLSATTTYTILSVSGSAGSQRLKISSDSVNPAIFTATGLGYFYIFRYPYIPVYYLANGKLSYDNSTPIDLVNDYTNQAVTVTAGTAASVADAAHPFTEGQAVTLGGTTAPGLGFLGMTLYVRNPTTNAYNLSVTPTGALIAFSSAGTAVTLNGRTVTITAGTPGAIALNNHFLPSTQQQPFTLAASVLPTGYAGQTLYVIANGLTNSSFQASERLGYPPAVYGSTGTTVTLTAKITGNFPTPIEKTQAYIFGTGITDSNIAFSATNGGAIIPLLSAGSGVHSITPVNTSLMNGNVLIRGIYE